MPGGTHTHILCGCLCPRPQSAFWYACNLKHSLILPLQRVALSLSLFCCFAVMELVGCSTFSASASNLAEAAEQRSQKRWVFVPQEEKNYNRYIDAVQEKS